MSVFFYSRIIRTICSTLQGWFEILARVIQLLCFCFCLISSCPILIHHESFNYFRNETPPGPPFITRRLSFQLRCDSWLSYLSGSPHIGVWTKKEGFCIQLSQVVKVNWLVPMSACSVWRCCLCSTSLIQIFAYCFSCNACWHFQNVPD